jgi:YggT family protein
MFLASILLQLINAILDIVVFVIFVQVIASWLVAFGVLNTRNRAVYLTVDMLERATAPLYRPIRRVIPPLGGLDLSPLILYLLITYVIKPILNHYFYLAIGAV